MPALSNEYDNLSQGAKDILFKPQDMVIGSERVGDDVYIDVLDPTNGTAVASIPEGTRQHVDKAVAAAVDAFENGPWSTMRAGEREKLIIKLAELVERDGQALSEVEAVESGRTLMNTKAFDVDFPADCLRYMAGWATKISGKTLPVGPAYLPPGIDLFAYTLREPVGVVAGIIPWNVPLCQAVWKIAPALATGCTIVLKPSELTPLTALRLGELALDAGIPPGVVNIVTGYGSEVGAALVEHPGISKISFTGSTSVGRQISAAASESFKKITLELGGKSPMIVMKDANLENAIPAVALGIFANHGQNCCAGSRLFIHDDVYEQVVEGVINEADNIVLGASLDPEAHMGPLVSMAQQARVLEYIDSGKSEGAEVVAGGEALDHPGAYVKPTVLMNARPDMRIVREEIFGPVLATMRFNDNDDILALANDTEYGLGASIYTENLTTAHQFVRGVKAGNVWVNIHGILDAALPFGGMKNSGHGHELGDAAILSHTSSKSAVVNVTQ
ncbi:MAG: aldehyde dehydrogenase family protein [Pseudomonadota bacterium]